MRRILALGSCRVDNPCDRLGIRRSGLNGTYATSDHIQGIRILRREIVVPEHLKPYVYFGPLNSGAGENLLDLREHKPERCVVEVCRLHSFVKDGWILMNYKKPYVDSLPPLDGVTSRNEDIDQIRSNLDRVREMLDGCPMFVMVPPTFVEIPVWYQLAFGLSSWCRDRKQTFFDPSRLTAQYGRERCFLKNGEDYFHFSDFMIGQVAARIQEWDRACETAI